MALKSQGVGIYILNTAVSPNAYNEIPDVNSISGPSGSAAIIDTTALDSTAKEKIMGLPDEGQVQLTMFWNGETNNPYQVALRTARAAQTLKTFQIRLTDSPQTIYQFNAYVTNWELSSGVDAAVEVNVTLEITNAVSSV